MEFDNDHLDPSESKLRRNELKILSRIQTHNFRRASAYRPTAALTSANPSLLQQKKGFQNSLGTA